MKRRDFIGCLGASGLAFALTVDGQNRKFPVIGFLRGTTAADSDFLVEAFRVGLRDEGYSERKNVTVEYRFANNELDHLPSLASDLVRRGVDVLVAAGATTAAVAKAATSTIPIVFVIGEDPQYLRLVGSLSHPGRNVTGITFLTLSGKRLEFLRLLAPNTKSVAYLVNPDDQATADSQTKDAFKAAKPLGLRLQLFEARNEGEIDAAFKKIVQHHVDAIHVGGHGLFLARRQQLVALAAQHAIPTTYQHREAVQAGGLMSYGASITDAYRQAGAYTARILSGGKPGDLAIQEPSKFDLVLNLKTANALGLKIPTSVLQRADEVVQ